MRRTESVILLGFMLVIIGFLILVTTMNPSGFFFFVFPFFFFGNVTSFSPIFLVILVVFSAICLYQLISFRSYTGTFRSNYGADQSRRCTQCRAPLPNNYNYCPICGMRYESHKTDSFDEFGVSD